MVSESRAEHALPGEEGRERGKKQVLMLILGCILAGYVIGRAILPLRLHWGWKIGLAVPVLLTAFKFHVLHWFGGPRFFAPELPVALLLTAAWLFTLLFLFFFLLLAADLVRGGILIVLLCRGRKPSPCFRVVGNRVNLGLLLAAGVLAAVGIGAGTAVPEVRHVTIRIPDLPEEADGMTIALLADIHADTLTRADRIREMVARTNAAKPDLIVLAGDLVDGTVEGSGAELLPLRELSAPYGVFGVPGNHEYYSGYGQWMPFLETLGIELLLNAHRVLPNQVVLAGVTDSAAARFGLEGPEIGGAFAGIEDGACRILVAHRPELAAEAAGQGVDLMLSGHTHGGMIVGVDRFIAGFNAGYVSGLYRVGEMALFITNGAGIWNGFPVRIGVPSEIALIHLVRN
ncbi:metallophosphoesterase [uncultured Victivallis sp.]|uniref:metallophosphoesterase n=1 Tax=uncultured Victivallis sp. TaxID=354118 RepID=UPI0025D7F924|nr:metallophosphoesterase [uncultured Victivallis sp.]